MTKITRLEQQITKAQARNAYYDRLIAVLAPDPSEWQYTGQVIDMGKDSSARCACSHPIRYGFVVARPRDGQTAIVGSECVNHFAQINPALAEELRAAVARLENDLKAAKQAAKRAQDEVEVEALRVEFTTKRDQLYTDLQRHYTRRSLNLAGGGRYYYPPRYTILRSDSSKFIPPTAPHYQRPHDFKRWYRQQIAVLDKHIAMTEAY